MITALALLRLDRFESTPSTFNARISDVLIWASTIRSHLDLCAMIPHNTVRLRRRRRVDRSFPTTPALRNPPPGTRPIWSLFLLPTGACSCPQSSNTLCSDCSRDPLAGIHPWNWSIAGRSATVFGPCLRTRVSNTGVACLQASQSIRRGAAKHEI